MQTVIVLLSAYNGEKYIAEQLDSVLAQEGMDVRIQIRDDGSTDGTLQILEQYRSRFPDRIRVEQGAHKGFSGSFLSLAFHAESADLYAFCDQDDVWLPDKLASAVSLISSTSGIPEMYFSNAILTDSRLAPIRPLYEDFRFPSELSMRLAENPAPGCTIVFNRTARDLFVQADVKKIVYYDFWMYLLCSYLGKVVYDRDPKVMYRQHDGNVMGYSKHKKTWGNRVKKLFHRLHLREYAASELLRLYGSQLEPAERESAAMMACYRKSAAARIRLLFCKKVRAADAEKNFWFKLQVILGSA